MQDLPLLLLATNRLDDSMDMAIRVGYLKDSSLVATRLTSTRWIICAALAYLEQRGAPSHPGELARHT